MGLTILVECQLLVLGLDHYNYTGLCLKTTWLDSQMTSAPAPTAIHS